MYTRVCFLCACTRLHCKSHPQSTHNIHTKHTHTHITIVRASVCVLTPYIISNQQPTRCVRLCVLWSVCMECELNTQNAYTKGKRTRRGRQSLAARSRDKSSSRVAAFTFHIPQTHTDRYLYYIHTHLYIKVVYISVEQRETCARVLIHIFFSHVFVFF